MALHDLGHLPFTEPFKRFRANGTITKDGAKISKSRGNIINPDGYSAHFGADVFRLYLMFMGPYEAGGDFNDRGIGGTVRFLDRVWQIITSHETDAAPEAPGREAKRVLHMTVKRVTEDIAAFKYNTAIAALMEYLNNLEGRQGITREELQTLLVLLAPLAPYITEELWERLGCQDSIHKAPWPLFDIEAIHLDVIRLPVQVNGRVRDHIDIAYDASDEEVKRQVLAAEKVQRLVAGQAVRRIIYVPGKLVNVVTA